jgi:hypothetical protein
MVVKPSGEMWMSCMGVSFHDVNDVESMLSAAKRLLGELKAGDAIMIEPYQDTFKPRCVRHPTDVNRCATRKSESSLRSVESLSAQLAWAAKEPNACRFRATACRGPDDRAHMTKVR